MRDVHGDIIPRAAAPARVASADLAKASLGMMFEGGLGGPRLLPMTQPPVPPPPGGYGAQAPVPNSGGPFYVSVLGQEQGPLDFNGAGPDGGVDQIKGDTPVRSGDSQQYIAAKDVPGLFSDKEWLTMVLLVLAARRPRHRPVLPRADRPRCRQARHLRWLRHLVALRRDHVRAAQAARRRRPSLPLSTTAPPLRMTTTTPPAHEESSRLGLLRRVRSSITVADVVAAGGVAGIGAAFLLSPDHIEDGPVLCPFRAITGLPCPGCGLTRSWVYAAHGWWEESFASNAFGLVVVAAVVALAVVVVARRVRRRRRRTSTGSSSTRSPSASARSGSSTPSCGWPSRCSALARPSW